jgi:hypothetical protein
VVIGTTRIQERQGAINSRQLTRRPFAGRLAIGALIFWRPPSLVVTTNWGAPNPVIAPEGVPDPPAPPEPPLPELLGFGQTALIPTISELDILVEMIADVLPETALASTEPPVVELT